jgi:hypothetical protein
VAQQRDRPGGEDVMGMKFFFRKRGIDVHIIQWTTPIDGHERALKWLVWLACCNEFKEKT